VKVGGFIRLQRSHAAPRTNQYDSSLGTGGDHWSVRKIAAMFPWHACGARVAIVLPVAAASGLERYRKQKDDMTFAVSDIVADDGVFLFRP
jgi:hypothetical protein